MLFWSLDTWTSHSSTPQKYWVAYIEMLFLMKNHGDKINAAYNMLHKLSSRSHTQFIYENTYLQVKLTGGSVCLIHQLGLLLLQVTFAIIQNWLQLFVPDMWVSAHVQEVQQQIHREHFIHACPSWLKIGVSCWSGWPTGPLFILEPVTQIIT